MRLAEFILPKIFANYLFNGDSEGLTGDEISAIDNFMTDNGLGCPVDAFDEGYRAFNALNDLGSECALYKFIRLH